MVRASMNILGPRTGGAEKKNNRGRGGGKRERSPGERKGGQLFLDALKKRRDDPCLSRQK